MNQIVLLFEVSDEFATVQELYLTYIVLGLIGLGISFWRWWAGFIWLLFPLSFLLAIHYFVIIDDISSMYKDIVSELGEIYIYHNYLSMILGVMLNIAGILIGFLKTKKIKLQ